MSKSIGHIQGVLSKDECLAILNSEHYGEEEIFGEYSELTVDVSPESEDKIISAVYGHLESLKIHHRYDLDCTKIAHIKSVIPAHCDPVHDEVNHNYTRHFVCVVYLTEFEMGEIIFPQHKKIIKPNQGDLVIFPTGPFYQHQVNISMGERWILRPNFDYRHSPL